jgi:hypothetical protein
MSPAESANFRVFQPFEPEDLPYFAGQTLPDLGPQIRDTSYRLYREIEAEALPAPQGATVNLATADLLAELPLHAAIYTVADSRHSLHLTSRFTVPLMPARRRQLSEAAKTVSSLAVSTWLTVEAERPPDTQLREAIEALRGVKSETDEALEFLVDAHTRLSVASEIGDFYWSFQCLRFHSKLRLTGSEANEPTRPALQIPSLRIVRTLINRGVEVCPTA